MADYRGYRIAVGPEGTAGGTRIAWAVFCDAIIWPSGVLMDGAVYLAADIDAEAAATEATRRARKLVDDYIDHGIDPRRSERRRMEAL